MNDLSSNRKATLREAIDFIREKTDLERRFTEMKQWDLDEFLEFVEEYLHDNGDCTQWIEQPFKDYDGIDIAVISVMQYQGLFWVIIPEREASGYFYSLEPAVLEAEDFIHEVFDEEAYEEYHALCKSWETEPKTTWQINSE